MHYANYNVVNEYYYHFNVSNGDGKHLNRSTAFAESFLYYLLFFKLTNKNCELSTPLNFFVFVKSVLILKTLTNSPK